MTLRKPSTWVAILSAAVVLWLMATKVDWQGTWHAIKTANPGLLAVALVISLGSLAGNAISLRAVAPQVCGKDLKIPWLQALAVQYVGATLSLLAPAGAGTLAANYRYLRRAGVGRSVALTNSSLVQVSQGVVSAVLVGALLIFTHTTHTLWQESL